MWTPVGLPGRLRRDAVDVFHAPYLVPPLSPCPSVVTVHDLAFRLLPECRLQSRGNLRSALITLSARRARAVITDSEWSRGDLIRLLRLSPQKVHVVPLAPAAHFTPGDVAAARQRVHERLGVQPPIILAVGYSSPRKNIPRLLEAVATGPQPVLREATVVIVGRPAGGGAEALRERFPALGNRLVFTDWISQDDLVALYRAANVLAFPSLYEGFGLPVLEAMACGTPVVSANTSSLPEVAGDAAVLVDPTDRGAIAEAVAAVLEDGALGETLSQKGLRRAAEFTWQRTARQTYEVYASVLSR